MSWREFGIAFLYWLPWPGEDITKLLFEPPDYGRLSFDAADSLYLVGTGAKKQALKQLFENEADRMQFLLDEEVFGNFGKHALVKAAPAYRGIWIVKY